MKTQVIGVLLLLGPFALASEFSARISIPEESDVVRLERLGVRLVDARVFSRRGRDGGEQSAPVWNPENGFVTVIADGELLATISASGYAVSETRPWVPPAPLPAETLLDTIPYQFGWPRAIFNGLSLYENAPAVADMNNDGQLEVSVTNAWGSYDPVNPPYLIVWRRSGAYLSGFPAALQPGQFQSSADAGIAAMGDLTGDSRLEIVCGDENGFLYAFAVNGQPLPGFPLSYGSSTGVFVPSLADVDGDGKSEIAVISHDWNSPYGNAFLHLLKVTAAGPQEMSGYPVNIQKGTRNGPSIGDLDSDGEMEIVVATGGTNDLSITARVIAFTVAGTVKPGFPWVIGRNSAGNNPTLYDIDNDGFLEILLRCLPDSTNINGIYAISHLGQLEPGFPFPITYGNPSACVAVGDMTGDGVPELAYGGVEAVDSGKVWVYDLGGRLLPGFPARVYRTWVDGSVAIADVDGDGYGDVVCGTNGVTSSPGLIRAFNRFGVEVAGFPLRPGNPILNSFNTHPAVVDIDGDGDTEIFAGRLDKFLYAWDTPGLFDSVNTWKMFKGNAARTGGQLRSPLAVAVMERGEVPGSLVLFQNFPNPFNPSTTIQFAIPPGTYGAGAGAVGRTSLQVFDMLGREVATLVSGVRGPGTYAVTFDVSHLAGGTYVYRLTAGTLTATKRMTVVK